METNQTYKGNFNGIEVVEYQMKNDALEVCFLNVGGALTKIALADDNYEQNLVLSFENIEDYLSNDAYLNALVGRTSNRIKDGKFTINETTYQLDLNNGTNNLHGGIDGLSFKPFKVEAVTDGYKLTTTLNHQPQGFPGNVSVTVYYTLNDNQFQITYEATTDQDTIINLTHHAYFNLSGNAKTPITNHELQIKADAIADIDDTQAFTKQWIPVLNTCFDFTNPTIINPVHKEKSALFERAFGYDHLYRLTEQNEVVTFKDPTSNRTLTVSTTAPAMQFYTGNFLTDILMFENHRLGEKHLGACFETHLVPFDFESQHLKPNETYQQQTTFCFTK